MAFITLRQANVVASPGGTVKGSPLTNQEVDNNFANINLVIGFRENLQTDFKDNVVVAINELNTDLGNVSLLDTTFKTNVVTAINQTFAIATSIATANIQANAITEPKIATNAVTSRQLFDNSVTDAKIRDGVALSVIGRASNSTGDPADIAAASDHQVLRRLGTSLSFGSIALDQATAVTGTLPVSSGGTGNTTSTFVNLSTNVYGTLAVSHIADGSIPDEKLTIPPFKTGKAIAMAIVFG